MKRLFFIFSLLLSLSGCTEVLRQPDFSVQKTRSAEDQFSYNVTGFDATPDVIESANRDPFIRYVNLSSNGVGPAKRVPESRLFLGPKPPSNKRTIYKIRVGDTILVNRQGHRTKRDGIETTLSAVETYLVSEEGAIDLIEGRRVLVEGLSIREAEAAVRAALRTVGNSYISEFEEIEFPATVPSEYRLGVGDVVRVSRLVETTNADGNLVETELTSESTIGTSGVVSILQLGEIEASGLTLAELRDSVLQSAKRNAGGLDTVVDIQKFTSKTALVTGDLGTRLVPITNRALTFERLIAELDPALTGGRDFVVKLYRENERFQMSARSILSKKTGKVFYVFENDRIEFSELIPETQLSLTVSDFSSRTLTYLRVRAGEALPAQIGRALSIDLRGVDLRKLLISEGVDVTQNKDLLIRLNRANKSFTLSAQDVVLNKPRTRYWLASDDHVVVEDIAYVGDQALIVGEVGLPRQIPVDRYTRTTLSQALFAGGAFVAPDADFRHVYVLRGEKLEYKAFHFDITKVLNLSLAEEFELRPGDIIFVRTRPLTRYTRALAVALNFLNSVDIGVTNARTFGR